MALKPGWAWPRAFHGQSKHRGPPTAPRSEPLAALLSPPRHADGAFSFNFFFSHHLRLTRSGNMTRSVPDGKFRFYGLRRVGADSGERRDKAAFLLIAHHDRCTDGHCSNDNVNLLADVSGNSTWR